MIRQLGPATQFCSFSSAETKWIHLLRIVGKLIVEYQQQDSPHIHMLIWLENAPVFGVDKDEEVIAFIDQIITCSKPDNDPKLLELVNRKTHRHSHTCRKKSENVCRFNYPQPPMRFTQILYPLDDDTSETVIKSKKNCGKTLKINLMI